MTSSSLFDIRLGVESRHVGTNAVKTAGRVRGSATEMPSLRARMPLRVAGIRAHVEPTKPVRRTYRVSRQHN